MFYPTKAHIRQLTGLTVAAALVGTLGYVGTRASLERQSTTGARTQDIALPAHASPVAVAATSQHLGRFMNGVASGAPAAAVGAVQEGTTASTAYQQLLAGPSSYSASGAASVSGGGSGEVGGSGIQARNHSAGGTGFSASGYGMGGVGAWGGVSGSARPAFAAAPAASPKLRVRTSAGGGTSNSRKSSGSGSGAVAGAAAVAPAFVAGGPLSGGFTTGAGAVAGASGSVPAVAGEVSSSGPSPAGTPEPMSLLLLGTGLAGLYGVRRFVL